MTEETNNLPYQDAADSGRSGDRRLSTCSALGGRVKVSKSARRDFEFFFATELNLIGGTDSDAVLIDQMQSPDGYTAVECWHLKDTLGKMLPCSESEALNKAIRGKKSWNLQIKEWAVDVADGMLLSVFELNDYTKDCPAWIFKATLNQARKIALFERGFIPKFLVPND